MRIASLFLTCLGLASLSGQNLVVNYLGGASSASGAITFQSPITDRAAIGVSPDGKFLYVTQAARGVILRYDLIGRTVSRIVVANLAEISAYYPSSQSITGIAVNADGTALMPLGARIARIELSGAVTIPGFPFTPQQAASSGALTVRSLAHPRGNARETVTAVFGELAGQMAYWAALANVTQNVGTFQTCYATLCDNTGLAADSPAGSYKAKLPWGLASDFTNAQQPVFYFTDPEGASNYSSFGYVASLRLGGAVNILGHASLSSIPPGSSGARLSRPTGIVQEANGNLLIADTGNHRILRRTSAGVWSVFAGTGTRGNRGDGASALAAEFFEPKSLSIDSAGTVYVHDSGNGSLRRILPSGVVERINTTTAPGAQAQPETLIQDLQLPAISALATDALGQIYAASQGRIVRVDSRGRATYIGGTGQYARSGNGLRAVDTPMAFTQGMTVDAQGRVIYSEPLESRIRAIETNGFVNTIAGNGLQRGVEGLTEVPDPVPALAAYMYPTAVSAAEDGSLLFIDGGWLRRLKAGQISSVSGVPWCGGFGDTGGTAYADGIPAIFACTGREAFDLRIARGFEPGSFLTVGGGRMLYDGNRGFSVRSIDAQGFVSTVARLTGMQIKTMAAGPNGSVYAVVYRDVADQLITPNYLLVRISASGQVTRLSSDKRSTPLPTPQRGQAAADLYLDDGVTIATDKRGFVYVPDATARRIVVFGEASTVEVDSAPSGLRVIVDGNTVTTPRSFEWLPGEYHTVTAEAEASGAKFLGWSDAQGSDPLSQTLTWMPAGGASRVVASYSKAPVLSQNGITDGAVFQPVLSNWSWSTIKGSNLARTTLTWDNAIENGKLPTSLGGVEITIDGQPVYPSYVSPTQINFLIPRVFTRPLGDGTLQLRTPDGVLTSPVSGSSNSTQIFGYSQGTSLRPWAFLNGGTELAGPPGAVEGLTSRPARPGETITIYLTGGIDTIPLTEPGLVLPSASSCAGGGPALMLDTTPILADYCGMIFPGVFQMNFRVPEIAIEGDLRLAIETGSPANVARLLRVAPTF